MYLEFLIRRSRFKWIQLLRESKVGATAMFSVLHACVMLGFLKKSSKNFWFTSLKIIENADLDDKTNKCKHIHGSLSCSEHFRQVRINLNFEAKICE